MHVTWISILYKYIRRINDIREWSMTYLDLPEDAFPTQRKPGRISEALGVDPADTPRPEIWGERISMPGERPSMPGERPSIPGEIDSMPGERLSL